MDIPSLSKICSVSKREFLPGEEFYSVLTDSGGIVRRIDISVEHWTEPEYCIGWWKSVYPVREWDRKRNADMSEESLLQIFRTLTAADGGNDTLYVLTLLLLRRKVLRLIGEKNKTMLVALPDGSEYPVPVEMPGQERLKEIQNTLSSLNESVFQK